jgi:mevalonate kinase
MTVTINSKSVCASAPGKVILFGEHAVVYGEPAIAAALSDLRIYVLITPVQSSSTLRIVMPDLPTPVDVLLQSQCLIDINDLQTPPTTKCAERLKDMMIVQARKKEPLDALAIVALTPLLYLIKQLVSSEIIAAGLEIHVRSKDLPVGAGLGSSAAFGVACAAALMQLDDSRTIKTATRPDQKQLELIDRYSYYSEILLHGTPSGIDNAVSAHGGAILFTKNLKEGGVTMDHINDMPPLQLMLVNTHVPRSTKDLVAGVRSMYDEHTSVTSCLLRAMGLIAADFRKMVSSGTTKTESAKVLKLVETNQLLLQAVEVSHPSLERICCVVRSTALNQAASKLTGAGGGGCAIVMFEDTAQERREQTVQRRVRHMLESERSPYTYTCFSSEAGGDGVLYIPPSDFPVHQQTTECTATIWTAGSVATATVVVVGIAAFFWLSMR